MNGGQPGWSTQQVLQNIEEFQSFSPTKVYVGLGVRDAQLSDRLDKDARPSPWIVGLNVFKWLQQLKKILQKGSDASGESSNEHRMAVSRVSPMIFGFHYERFETLSQRLMLSFISFPR